MQSITHGRIAGHVERGQQGVNWAAGITVAPGQPAPGRFLRLWRGRRPDALADWSSRAAVASMCLFVVHRRGLPH